MSFRLIALVALMLLLMSCEIEAKRRSKRCKAATLTIMSSDCNRLVEGVTFACNKTMKPLKFTVVAPGIYKVRVKRLPKTIAISKDGFQTMIRTLEEKDENIILQCAGPSCTADVLTVNVTSDCIECVQRVKLRSSDVITYTSTVPGIYELAVCSFPVTVVFSKHLFVTQTQTFNSNIGTVEMICRRRPFFVEHPQSKYRALGEDVKLCCWADTLQQSADLQFKWYHNGVEISTETEQNLEITNIVDSHKGVYKCKASITIDGMTQAIMSDDAELIIIADSSDFSSELSTRMVEIAAGCVVDVGHCNRRACKTIPSSTEECTDDGVVCPSQRSFTEMCAGVGDVSYVKSTGCTCCTRPMITINVEVTAFDTGSPVVGATVHIEHVGVSTTTDGAGKFTVSVKPEVRRLVFRTSHSSNYVETVTVERITKGFLGPLDVKIVIFKKADPVVINSSEETKLAISSTPLVEDSSEVSIIIPKDCFFTQNKEKYTGMVNAIVTEFSAGDRERIQNAPGEFITYNDNGIEQSLVSRMVFTIEFRDLVGNPLLSKMMSVFGDLSWLLWQLSTDDGAWVELTESAKRKKRMIGTLGTIDLNTLTIFNIDKFPQQNICWFKTRLFEEDGLNENQQLENTQPPNSFESIPSAIIFSGVTDFLPLNNLEATSTPSQTCYEARCDEDVNMDPDTVGLIEMKVVFDIENLQTLTVDADPVDLASYPVLIMTSLSGLSAQTTQNTIELQFHSNPAGPFYETQAVCENSGFDEPAFWFKATAPEQSNPYPDNDRCVANVKYMAAIPAVLAALLNYVNNEGVKATSKWGPNLFIVRDTMNPENVMADSLEVCIEYRCSRAPGNVPLTDGPTEVTVMQILHTLNDMPIRCSAATLNPDVLMNSNMGYYLDTTGDVGSAIDACIAGAEVAIPIDCVEVTPQK